MLNEGEKVKINSVSYYIYYEVNHLLMNSKRFVLLLVLLGVIISLTACTPQNKDTVVGLEDNQTEKVNLQIKQTLDVYPEVSEVWIMLGETITIEPQFQGFVNPEIIYISEDPKVASVDEDGNIKANELGETEIYVMIHSSGENDYMIKSIDIKVEFSLHTIEIEPKYVSLIVGEEVSIDINTFPQEAKKFANFTFEVSDENCFLFDVESCKIKGLKEGRGILKIIYEDENRKVTRQCVVNVKGVS